MTETKRRGPIGAEYSSPGPIYQLPPLVGQEHHDLRYNKDPAWQFGVRHGKMKDDSSPGPCYFVDAKLLRKGPDQGPSFSIYSRPKEPGLFETPDPNRYNCDSANKHVYKSAASYSFGLRRDTKYGDTVPGPNVYSSDPMFQKTIRSTKASAPFYSIYSRRKMGGFGEDLSKTPGPGTYSIPQNNIYKKALPSISIGGRIPIPGDNTVKPGPQSYYPKLNPSYSYTFGQHHSPYRGQLIVDGDIDD